MPGMIAAPISAAGLPSATPGLLWASADPNAAATPTPFQPIPPTPVYIPTEFPTPTPLPPTPAPPEERKGPASKVDRPEGQVTILLLGSDHRPWWGRLFRTDTIILATLNPSLGTVSLVSFPRDLYVHIPGWGQDRINTAWGHGGFESLAKTLEYNFGVYPDHYVLINFSSFKRVVDSLGGLEVEVNTPLADYYRGRYVTVDQGVHTMDADKVLWYVRSRKTSNDFARNRRQQEVLQAMVSKFLSLDAVKRAPELYNIYKDSVTTDMGLADMLPLLPLATQLSDSSRIRQHYIGPKQFYYWITPGGAMVLLPRQDAILKIIRQALGGE